MSGTPVGRLFTEAEVFDTLDVPTVEIFFQRWPGVNSGNDRGVDGMEFQVSAEGRVIQRGRTGPDGRIEMQVRGVASTLQILSAGAVVSEYSVSTHDAMEAVTTVEGQQRRLLILGYDVGPDGVDGQRGGVTERAMLDFQADTGITMQGRASTETRNRLTAEAGE